MKFAENISKSGKYILITTLCCGWMHRSFESLIGKGRSCEGNSSSCIDELAEGQYLFDISDNGAYVEWIFLDISIYISCKSLVAEIFRLTRDLFAERILACILFQRRFIFRGFLSGFLQSRLSFLIEILE